jgi:hypothetical protein
MTGAPTSLRVVVLLCGLMSYGCSTVVVQSNVERVEIAKNVYLSLPKAEEITRSFDATQLLVADYEEQSYSFQAQLEVRPGKITIAAITMWGGTLFSITYDGSTLRAQGMIDEHGVNAEYMLADILLMTWEPEWVNARLQGAVLDISRSNDSRTVSRDGEPVIEIFYDMPDGRTGRTHFKHLERGYALDIRTAEFSGL